MEQVRGDGLNTWSTFTEMEPMEDSASPPLQSQLDYAATHSSFLGSGQGNLQNGGHNMRMNLVCGGHI